MVSIRPHHLHGVSSPNVCLADPLFYLHHTQLDRLWYIWQQRDPEARLTSYSGHNQRHSMEMAKLSDKIKMQGWAPEIEVQEVMSTEGELLCYRY
jgi:tyrosinase